MYTDCEPILLFEDDAWPVAAGWEEVWISAAYRWQHVNYGYAFEPKDVPGSGTVEDPYQFWPPSEGAAPSPHAGH